MNHFNVSIVKSALRVFGFAFLMDGRLVVAGLLLILAEGLGVLEEMV